MFHSSHDGYNKTYGGSIHITHLVLSSEYTLKSAVLKTTIKETRCGIREIDK
jgi:hypothetical protein